MALFQPANQASRDKAVPCAIQVVWHWPVWRVTLTRCETDDPASSACSGIPLCYSERAIAREPWALQRRTRLNYLLTMSEDSSRANR